ncbi:cobalt-precorrin 5A hydrolase / precorrin-3B C17-methyltransferase [Devosia sp. YR412]|uniref:cobalamin biosynthesis protein n=1 Tax=Devosia sp. YR412 TaxID=1881030 RepID=UPI0008C8A804|nr:cobalamin biosynthesis protein [Devosia sp. YR412]SEP85290.1 cobalt-precorrin 5A hydrolase / precorrin-3B C17-methyltransferase [Devosia sp. YR412]
MTTIPDDVPIVIGLGCATAAEPREIIGLIEMCLSEANLHASQIAAMGTHVRKRDSLALMQAAAHFDLELRFLDDDDLAPGVPGTCEAVAAAAGPLLLGKRKSRYATCAIALAAPGFDLSGFGQPASPSAAMASSTLATSLAGP